MLLLLSGLAAFITAAFLSGVLVGWNCAVDHHRLRAQHPSAAALCTASRPHESRRRRPAVWNRSKPGPR